jgi:UTP--glucose-1-phosphate uridylyltransferase
MSRLADDLAGLPASILARLKAHAFDVPRFLQLAKRLEDPAKMDNHVKGKLAAPEAGDIEDLPPPGSKEAGRFRDRGLEMLGKGRCALVVLAGGMATRMGGVVKALEPALPGKTFLELRLAERRSLERQSGGMVPLWLMTSDATDAKIRLALGSAFDGERVAVFSQRLSVRLTPEGALFRDAENNPSEHAPGHGDLPDALKDSGLFQRFLDRGGEYLMVANLDNLGATLDPTIVGFHRSHGKPVTCEVVDQLESDRGGIPVRHEGRVAVLEEFRIPPHFDPASVRVFNTNTFHFDAKALAALSLEWTYFVVKKQVEGRPAIQFERLINEVTSHLDTAYLRVPRSGAQSRFLPVKDREELARRHDEIEAVARSRGMLA